MKTIKRQHLTRGGGISVDSSHLPTHSQTPSHKSHFFKPLIASSLALALGVSVASATTVSCYLQNIKNCTPATDQKSGMWYGDFIMKMTEATMGSTGELNGFGWDTAETGILKPISNYNTLSFTFIDGSSNSVSGQSGSNNSYDIIIGGSATKIFIFNAGDKTLKSHIALNGKYNSYDIRAKRLNGSLTISGEGTFAAHLTEGFTGEIHNTNLNNTTYSRAYFRFGSISENKTVTLNGNITATGSGASNTLMFSKAKAEINGSIIAKENGRNSIVFDGYPNTLTLNGAENIINDFRVAAPMETKLIIGATAKTNIIQYLVMGSLLKGNLTIDNTQGGGALKIKTLVADELMTRKEVSKLTLSGKYETIDKLVLADRTITSANDSQSLNLDVSGVTSNNKTLIITEFENRSKYDALIEDTTLIISAGKVKITNALRGQNDNIALDSTNNTTTLILNNANGNSTITRLSARGTKGNTLSFNKNLTINTLKETVGITRDTKLTFVNTITGNQTAGHLVVAGSHIYNPDNVFDGKDSQLKGTYKMAIQGDKTIKPEEIKYNETSKEGVKVATIKKHSGAISGSTDQAELRSQGVINLGAETDMTLQSDFSLMSFNYYVAETDETGNTQVTGKDYITYFLNGKGSGNPPKPDPENPQRPQSVQEIILSNVALSTTGLYLANFNSLNKRMGELRDNNHSQGAWGRVFNGMQSNSIGLKSSAIYTTIQAGYDYAFGFEGANNYLGFAISYGHSESKFKNDIAFGNNSASFDSSVSDLVEFALYNSYVQDSGWYNDTVAKFSYLMNRIELTGKSSSRAISSKKGDINTYALTLSNEFGYRFKLGASDEWYIDPQAEMGFGYFEGQDLKFKESNSPLAKLGTMDSLLTLRGRVGASFGYDFKNFTSKENGLSAKLYLGVFGEFDYFNGGDVKFEGGIAENAIKTDARAVINVGTNLKVKDATRIYVDFESSFGGKIATDYKINAGVRYSFGENTNHKSSNAVQKDNEVKEAPIKLQEVENEEEEE